MAYKEGTRRLALFAGGVGMILGIVASFAGLMHMAGRIPSATEFIPVLLFPILGFFIPWALMRGLTWVLAGFGATEKESKIGDLDIPKGTS